MSYEQRFRKNDESKDIRDQISNYSTSNLKYQPIPPQNVPLPKQDYTYRSWEQERLVPQQIPLTQSQNIPISQLDISKYLPQNQPQSFHQQEQVPTNLFEFGQRENIRDPFETNNETLRKDVCEANVCESKVCAPNVSPLQDITKPIAEKPEVERQDMNVTEAINEETEKVEEETRRKVNQFIEKTKEFLVEAEKKMLAKYAEAKEAIANIHLDQTKAKLVHAYDATKEKVGQIADSIVESTKEELGLAKMAIEYTYENLKEGVGEYAGKVSEAVKHGVSDVKHGVDVAKEKVVDFTTHTIPEDYQYVKDKAFELYEATKEKVVHISEDLVDKTRELIRPKQEALDETLEKLAERLKEDQEKERDEREATREVNEENIVTRTDQFEQNKL